MTGMGPYYEEIFVEYFCLFCIVIENYLFPSNDSPMILLGLIFFQSWGYFLNSSLSLVFLVVKFLTDNFSCLLLLLHLSQTYNSGQKKSFC